MAVTYQKKGYVLIYQPDHPMSHVGYVQEHTLVAEKALGKPLPKKAVIHHVDEDRQNNSHENLVICEDIAYHNLLHRRLRALKACGNANYRKCWICKQYDSVDNLKIYNGSSVVHSKCINDYHNGLNNKRKRIKEEQSL